MGELVIDYLGISKETGISHTNLSEERAHAVPGGGMEELERSGATPVLPA
jgi:hypothetical protein